MEDLAGGCRALRSEALRGICHSPNVITTIKHLLKWQVMFHATVTYAVTPASRRTIIISPFSSPLLLPPSSPPHLVRPIANLFLSPTFLLAPLFGRQRQHNPPKDSYPPTSLHGVTVQKAEPTLLFKTSFSVNIHFVQQ